MSWISEAGNIRVNSSPIAIGQNRICNDRPKFLKDLPNSQSSRNKKVIIKMPVIHI